VCHFPGIARDRVVCEGLQVGAPGFGIRRPLGGEGRFVCPSDIAGEDAAEDALEMAAHREAREDRKARPAISFKARERIALRTISHTRTARRPRRP
jgi:hypothetical protein